MKIFITGASGLVGSYCFRYLESIGHEIKGSHVSFPFATTVYFDFSYQIENLFYELSFFPDVIIHCGALTNVDYCELHEAESYNSSVVSTQNIANYCIQKNVKLVFFSSDYVFNGINGPYSEFDSESPVNIYGKHKVLAEDIVKKVKNSLICRITNVYGEEPRNKNFIARLLFNIERNEPIDIKLPYDQFATPIYAGDVAKMVSVLIENCENGIYHLASTDYYSRFQLALKVKSFFQNRDSINLIGVKTSYLEQPAKRPLNGGLLNIKFQLRYPSFAYTNIDSFIENKIEK